MASGRLKAVLGSLLVRLGLNDAQFSKGLKRAKKKTNTFEKSLTRLGRKIKASFLGLGAAIAGVFATKELARFTAQTLKSAKEIKAFSDRIGISTEALTQFRFAGEEFNILARQMDTALQRMVRRVGQASHNIGEARDELIELGLDAKKLSKAGPEKTFLAIADALQKIGSQADRVRIAEQIFDTEGVALLPLLQKGSVEIQKFMRQADALGITLSSKTAEGAAKASQDIERLGKQFKAVFENLVLDAAPILSDFANLISEKLGQGGGILKVIGMIGDAFLMIGEKTAAGFAILMDNFSLVAQGINRTLFVVRGFGHVWLLVIKLVSEFWADNLKKMSQEAKSTFEGIGRWIAKIAIELRRVPSLRAFSSHFATIALTIGAVASEGNAAVEEQIDTLKEWGAEIGETAQKLANLGIEEQNFNDLAIDARNVAASFGEMREALAAYIDEKIKADRAARFGFFGPLRSEGGAGPIADTAGVQMSRAIQAAFKQAENLALSFRTSREESEATLATIKELKKILDDANERLKSAGLEGFENPLTDAIVARAELFKLRVEAVNAAADIEAAFVDALVNIEEHGFKGLLKAWAKTIQRMLAEAATAKLFEALFGRNSDGSSGLANILSGFLTNLVTRGQNPSPNTAGNVGNLNSGPYGKTGGGFGAVDRPGPAPVLNFKFENNIRITNGGGDESTAAQVERAMNEATNRAVSKIADMGRRGQLVVN